MSTSSDNSLPYLPDNDSPGSSVSSSLQKEYDELLKYAVVTPRLQVGQNVYEKSIEEAQPPSKTENHVRFSDVSVNSSSSTESKTFSSETSQSTYSDELSYVAREGVARLPNSPAVQPASISLIGQGSLARDSLLKDASDTPNEDNQSNVESPSPDSPSSEHSVDSSLHDHGSPTIDADLARMEAFLDSWCLDLKRNVLAELAQCKMGLFEKQKQLVLQEKRRHHADRNKLLNEMESQKELLYTFEQSIKHKDSIVANVTSALQRQRDKFELLKGFSHWKIKHSDETREAFTSKLSNKHYNHTLQSKAWRAWRHVIESKWKQRVEKACQSKSQEVCIKLTEDYESKLGIANQELDEARQEIARLHAEREVYEETMKKAFMRGVCALNLEAMTMFREGEEGGRNAPSVEPQPAYSGDIPRFQPPKPVSAATGIPTAQSSVSTSQSGIPYKPAATAAGKRIINVKATGREDLKGAKGGAGLVGHQGPVSSILVHRHSTNESKNSQPIKQPTTSMRTTTKSRSVVKTIHSTPLKVVH